jgi:hypothetical protein
METSGKPRLPRLLYRVFLVAGARRAHLAARYLDRSIHIVYALELVLHSKFVAGCRLYIVLYVWPTIHSTTRA